MLSSYFSSGANAARNGGTSVLENLTISHKYDIYNFHTPTISFDEIFFNCPNLFPELRYFAINLFFHPDLRYYTQINHYNNNFYLLSIQS